MIRKPEVFECYCSFHSRITNLEDALEYNCLFMIENIFGSCQTISISFLYFVVQEKVTLQLQLVAEVYEVLSQLPNPSDPSVVILNLQSNRTW
jgi:hypothetical protein